MRDKVKIKILQNMLREITKKYDYFLSLKEEVLKETFEKAIRDPLTQLYNRNYLMERLNELLAKAKRNETKVVLSFIDLNNFKYVNDTYGHEEDDKILQTVAKILKNNFRQYDIVSRYGGDEFILVLENIDINKMGDLLDRANQKIKDELSKYNISISFGVATSDETTDIEKLIALADERMYENKIAHKHSR